MSNLVTTPDTGARAGTRPAMHIQNLRCEYLVDPLGIGTKEPRLSWVITSEVATSEGRDIKQQSYQILVAARKERLTEKKADLWNSGKVTSDRMFHIVYAGKPLQSEMRCFWVVRVWDQHGNASAWSEPATFTVGLLNESDWGASWIGAPAEAVSDSPRPANSSFATPAKAVHHKRKDPLGAGLRDEPWRL